MKNTALKALTCLAGIAGISALPACKKKSATAEEEKGKGKAPKKTELVATAWKEREALNILTAALRELAAVPAEDSPRAARAGAIREKLRKVPDRDLPEPLRAPWQEMMSVLDAAAGTPAPETPAELQKRGAAAAAALNTALAGQGLTEFKF